MRRAFITLNDRSWPVMCLCALIFASVIKVSGQQVSNGPQSTGVGVVGERNGDEERNNASYRLGPGDSIELRVSKHTELSRDSIRIDNNGTVTIPRINEEIQAACLTERELANVIRAHYDGFLVNPEVAVSVKEYNSQPVAVIGAVNAPGRFQLRRSARLLELLMLVNGPSASAGRTVHVVHTSDGMKCTATNQGRAADAGFVAYQLEKTLRADEGSNPYLLPGDVVRIPEAEQVYIIGNVKEPKSIALREELTLSRAIAMVSGVLPDSNTEKIRIVRQQEGSGQTELIANLKAINRHQEQDIVLHANDVIEVPGASGARKILQGFARSLLPGLTQYPLYVLR
jgi:polysaccharide export outer membrane protein